MKSRTRAMTVFGAGAALMLGSALAHAQPAPRPMPPCTTSGQMVTLSLNTGSAGPNPPPGKFDPFWRLINTADLFSTKKHPAWVAPPPGSRWVQRNIAGTPVNFNAGIYTYVTRFSIAPLSAYQPNSVMATGWYSADNDASVLFNGGFVAGCANCFPTLHALPTVNVTTPGINMLTVQVTNTSFSPSALLVRASVRAVCM